ncbi:hypothetical protein QFC24_003011 [Naganishia onofrii]|uniref:Uncharacterized protein n=1 Tax=Naganishia onofrii TaxID=1851511 RepID=A0ACC2XKT4_9TREE|nr:hypothetical protein QFC24_003011 [Naganishia onofrii]
MHDDADADTELPGGGDGDPFSDPSDVSLYQAWKAYKQQHSRPGVEAVGMGLEQAAWGDALLGDAGFGGVPVRDRLEAWAGWLNPWGEGELLIFDKQAGNISIPHRPAAYPAHLPPANAFPVQGTLLRIEDFPGAKELGVDEYGCAELPSPVSLTASYNKEDLTTTPPTTNTTTTTRPLIALIIRGHCSFSHKTRLAQHLSAHACIIADDTATPSETDEQGRTRTGLITMYSPDDTTDVRVGSTFVSRAGGLVVRDLMDRERERAGAGAGAGGVEVRIEPDDGYDWPLSDLLVFIMLLPSVITIFAILLNKYRTMRQRQRDRAPKETVFALPEAIWVPEEWEKEDDSPAPTLPKSGVARVSGGGDADAGGSAAEDSAGSAGAGAGAGGEGGGGGAVEEQEEEQCRPPFGTGMPKQKPRQSSSFTAIGTTNTGTTTTNATATVKKRKFYSKDECAICLGSFERGDVIRILPCGHLFHKLEVDDWDITATPSDSTLAIPTQTATTPLTAVPPAPTSDTDTEPHGGWSFGSAVWERMRKVFRNRNRAAEVEGQGVEREEGEETPLLRV